MELDWKNLSFGYLKTDYNIRSYYRNGSWSEPELTSDETVSLHMAATCLHYGQEVFEGQKAFRGADGVIRIFRPEENAKRLQSSADYLKMAIPPVDLVVDMMKRVVKANERFVPPYGTGVFSPLSYSSRCARASSRLSFVILHIFLKFSSVFIDNLLQYDQANR